MTNERKTGILMILAGTALLAALCALALQLLRPVQKTAYIRTQKLFQEFAMTKELQARLQNKEQARKTILQEYELQIARFTTNTRLSPAQKDSLAQLQEAFQAKREELASDHRSDTEEYDQQIWTQLNQYIQEYGKEKGIGVILGADGSGTLMYAPESMDETERVIEFANQQYQGK